MCGFREKDAVQCVGVYQEPKYMAMKPVLTLLSVLVFPSFGVLAQQPTSAGPPAVPVEVEEWMRAAWGMDPQVLASPTRTFCCR